MRQLCLQKNHIIQAGLALLSSFVLLAMAPDSPEAIAGNALREGNQWQGPVTGPAAESDKTIIFVGSDLRNGGVSGVVKGVSEAADAINWRLRFLDGNGSALRQHAALSKAIALRPDGIILGGMDARDHRKLLNLARQLNIPVVGWHALHDNRGNSDLGIFANITTDAAEVARAAAALAIQESGGKARAVIISDPRYAIAEKKATVMAVEFLRCYDCKLLRVESVPLSETARLMPHTMERLFRSYGSGITHIMVINDLYIDFAIPTLENSGLAEEDYPEFISAGDGSRAAFNRISNRSHQLATVPEPLIMQGWQLIDEMNRAFNGVPPSNYSAPAHLITQQNITRKQRISGLYDPDNGYRDAYMDIWSTDK